MVTTPLGLSQSARVLLFCARQPSAIRIAPRLPRRSSRTFLADSIPPEREMQTAPVRGLFACS